MKKEINKLCPCGSGKKYKKCCLALEGSFIQHMSEDSDIDEMCDKALERIDAGDLPGAEREAKRLYQLYPDDYSVNFLKGVCLVQREKHQEAIFFFEKCVQTNPRFSEAHFNLAILYRQQGQVAQSVDCFVKVIEIEGEQDELAKSAMEELDWLETVIQKTSGLTLEEYLRGAILFAEAFELLKKKQYKKSISLFQQILDLDPNHVQSHSNIGIAYSALAEQKMALQYLEKALLLDPTYEPAKNNKMLISKLKEGEKNSFVMEETFYYEEKCKSAGLTCAHD